MGNLRLAVAKLDVALASCSSGSSQDAELLAQRGGLHEQLEAHSAAAADYQAALIGKPGCAKVLLYSLHDCCSAVTC